MKARERLAVYGPDTLGDADLLSVLLPRNQAAENLLSRFGLVELAQATQQELAAIPGMGPASASAIVAAFELCRRVARLELPYAPTLGRSADVARYLRSLYGDQPQENFVVLGLDARQRVRLVRTVGVGSLAQVDVHPREVFRPLVRAGCHAAIIAHNHPSGDAEPSPADIELTKRMVEAGRLVGIPVLDHLIVTRTDSVSLASMGMMPC